MKFSKKETPKINITKKTLPMIKIREVFPSRFKKMVGEHGFDTLKVDPSFGQSWNLPNFSTEDTYYFGNHFYNQISENEAGMLDEANTFYQTLVRLNPELQNIKIENTERMLDVIRGVGSGLHFNDIKYFIEELKGNAKNESENDNQLYEKAIIAYFKRSGIDLEEEISEEKIKEIMNSREYVELSNKTGFAFSPETSQRIIDNNPY